MKLNILTNSRPTSNLGTSLTVGCTSGQIKMTPDFGKLLGVVDGDYIAIGRDNEGRIWCLKGDDKGQAKGNKLAKSGHFLSMSSQNVWDILDGDTAYNKTFTVVKNEDDEEVTVDEDGSYVEIAFDSQEEKTERKASAKAETAENDRAGEEVEEEEEI